MADQISGHLIFFLILSLMDIFHLITIWSCGHQYKIQGWTHVKYMSTICHPRALLCIAVQCFMIKHMQNILEYLIQFSMELSHGYHMYIVSIYDSSSLYCTLVLFSQDYHLTVCTPAEIYYWYLFLSSSLSKLSLCISPQY